MTKHPYTDSCICIDCRAERTVRGLEPPREWEAYAASRKQSDGRTNEDKTLITPHVIALANGAGAAEGCATRALSLFSKLVGDKLPAVPDEWSGVVSLVDSSMSGGPQSTLVALFFFGVLGVGGVYAGDSRAYRITRDGACTLLTEAPSKRRLGSSEVDPQVFSVRSEPGDLYVLASDGAWAPMGLPERVGRTVMKSVASHSLPDVPSNILDERRTHADDSTVLIARERHP